MGRQIRLKAYNLAAKHRAGAEAAVAQRYDMLEDTCAQVEENDARIARGLHAIAEAHAKNTEAEADVSAQVRQLQRCSAEVDELVHTHSELVASIADAEGAKEAQRKADRQQLRAFGICTGIHWSPDGVLRTAYDSK